jgi:hypothetical protein
MCRACCRECDGACGAGEGERNGDQTKEKETLANIELIAHSLKFYIKSIFFSSEMFIF